MEAVDKLLADTEATLAAEHLTDNTYIVFSSDNGYHLGQHRLLRGKQTAFDTDIRVPLIVAGPGVPAGRTVMPQVVQNIDLYPTFVRLAGANAGPADRGAQPGAAAAPGRQPDPPWRTVALVEHHGGNLRPGRPRLRGRRQQPDDVRGHPDLRAVTAGLRWSASRAVYVEYDDRQHEIEYYDIAKDPYEQHNVAADLTAAQRTELHGIITGMKGLPHRGRVLGCRPPDVTPSVSRGRRGPGCR